MQTQTSDREAVAAQNGPSTVPAAPAPVYRCFLFTDVEGSTSLWERYGEEFREALDLHHATIREVIREYGGQELVEAGDGFLVSFAETRRAVECAAAAQRALSGCEWPVVSEPLRIRMGLHAGEVEPKENGEYRGIVINRAARVRDTAHGEQIVCSAEVARAVDGLFPCRALGRFRLKGLPAPEQLFQVHWPGMPERSFPVPNAVPAYTHNLPRAATRFVGRTGEIAAIRELLLAREGGRLVTLTGPGGTGKTRLSLVAAESLLAEFSHAVFFIALAETHEAEAIAREITQALRLDPNASASPEEQIATFFGREPALLVLDNFEQLAEVGAPVIQKLLASVPGLRCLISSRQRLHLPGEREYPVPPLRVPEETDTPEELAGVESVQLFVDRAQIARSSFTLHERNAAAVGELCRRLDGVPLAVELAAARADVSTPQEILGSLGSRLDALSAADEATPARHRTLRAAIDWSFEHLPPALREFFANLSVFRGGWTADGAEAVAAVPGLGEVSANILRALSELRSASLIVAEESGEMMRFRMLETLRQYAEERLKAKGDADAITHRHRLFYMALAETAQRELLKKDQQKWLDRLETEHDNFRAILADTCTDTIGLQIASDLVQFWSIRGYHTEARAHLARHMAKAEGASPLVRLCAANAAGYMANRVGDRAAARAYFEQAVEICRESDNQRNLPGMLANVGLAAMSQNALEDAERYLTEAHEAYLKLGTQEQMRAHCLCMLAGLTIRQRNPSAAIDYAERALEILRPLEDWYYARQAIGHLGLAHCMSGSYETARVYFQEAMRLSAAEKSPESIAYSFMNFALLARMEGDIEEAVRLSSASIWMEKQYGAEDDELHGIHLEVLGNLSSELPAERYEVLRQEGQLMGKARMKELEAAKRR